MPDDDEKVFQLITKGSKPLLVVVEPKAASFQVRSWCGGVVAKTQHTRYFAGYNNWVPFERYVVTSFSSN